METMPVSSKRFVAYSNLFACACVCSPPPRSERVTPGAVHDGPSRPARTHRTFGFQSPAPNGKIKLLPLTDGVRSETRTTSAGDVVQTELKETNKRKNGR